MLSNAKQEVSRSPLALLIAGVGSLASAGSLYLAYRDGGASFAPPPSTETVTEQAYLLVLAAYLAFTSTAALLARWVHNRSPVSAYFASIVIASVVATCVTLVIRTQGVRLGSPTGQPANTHWAVYWGVVFLFFAINAESIFERFRNFSNQTRSADQDPNEEAKFALVSLGLLSVAWLVAVRNGQSLLAGGLL